MIKKLSAAAMAGVFVAYAATSTTWETGSSSELLKGRLQSLSLTAEGGLRPGPAQDWNKGLNQPVLWKMALAPDGGVYAATGHGGKVFHVDRGGTAKLIWTADQPEVFALCVDGKGRLFAGTSPNGGVYRIENGKASEVAKLDVKYIWALAVAADGSIYAGTGDEGRIYRIDPSGKAEIYFETGQSNVTALAIGPGGQLYAGSEPNGLLYRITDARHGTVVYDSSLPEIHAMAIRADGTVFAAALGGSLTSRTKTPVVSSSGTGSTVVATTPTVISVSEAKENGEPGAPEQTGDVKPKEPAKSSVTSTVTPVTASSPQFVNVSGVEKSAIYDIHPNGMVETLRTSKEDNVYDLVLDADRLLFSTDVRGRIFSITENRKQVMLAETGDSDANQLVKTAAGVWVGLSNPAKVVLLGNSTAVKPVYESPVHDTTTLARWGQLQWEAIGPGVTFSTRTGNSARPDDTWSSWSAPIRDQTHAGIQSPRGRYIQWRAEWAPGSTSELQNVVVPFLPQNTPPVVRSVSVTSTAVSNTAKASASSGSTSSAYTVTVTDSADPSPASTSSTGTQTLTQQSPMQVQITWQADDPDGDKLIYSLYFRGDGEREWKLLRKDISDNTLTLDPDVFADGRYYFRVVASDRPSNDLRYAQQSDFVSTPVLIDNTPPTVVAEAPARNGNAVDVTVSANDSTSPLRKCEYSIDAGPWQPVEAADGITDSQREQFHLHLENLKPGEHVIVVRVYDSAGNAGLAKVVSEQ